MVVIKSIFYASYFLILAYLVLLSGDDYRLVNIFSTHKEINFIPIREKILFFTSGQFFGENNWKFFLKEFFGNLLMFVPFSIILMLGEGMNNNRKVISYAFFTSFFIETIQYLTGMGHADIDDLILNTLGAYLGVLLSRWTLKQKFWNNNLRSFFDSSHLRQHN